MRLRPSYEVLEDCLRKNRKIVPGASTRYRSDNASLTVCYEVRRIPVVSSTDRVCSMLAYNQF